jgi:2-dehydro-3-deoxyphosphogluconate aldolase/(4S)-4-hydroxy-2-oxoglutarate aldolase
MNVIGEIRKTRIIAVVRLEDLSQARQVTEALVDGGVTVVEFTLTNRDALRVIEELREEAGPALIGAGTVLDAPSAHAAILAGARFLVTPVVSPQVIEEGRRYGVPVISGGTTPTELLGAHVMGSELVKVFPAGTLGPGYLRDLKGPLPQLRLVPTGGVTLSNVARFLEAGAFAVGIGGALVGPGKSPEEIAKTAASFVTEARPWVGTAS